MAENKKYRLFVGKTVEVPQGVVFSFYNQRHGYTLLYADQDSFPGYDAVPDEILGELSQEERVWLLRAKNKVMKQFAAEHNTEIADFMGRFLTFFEEELQKMSEHREEK